MKNLLTLLILVASVQAFASNAELVPVPVDDIYVPKGFDTNDNVEVVVTGYLPDLCHHSPKALVKREGNNVKVEVKSYYKQPADGSCPEMIVPFTETVNLGLMNKGKYKISVNENEINKSLKSNKAVKVQSELLVEATNSTYIDDNVYAAVDFVKKDYTHKEIEINALNPSDCFELDTVKFVSNGKNTYSVLPIMKQVRAFCPMKMTNLKIRTNVPTELNREKVLLHIRSMEGKSYNTIFNNSLR